MGTKKRVEGQPVVHRHGIPGIENPTRVLTELKGAVEELTRQSGTVESSSLTVNDLLKLGVINTDDVYKLDPGGAKVQSKPLPGALKDSSVSGYGSFYYPKSSLEVSNGITPSKWQYEPGDPRRYNAKADGVTEDSSALITAFSASDTVKIAEGTTYLIDQTAVPAGKHVTGTGTLKADAVFGGQGLLYCDSAGAKVSNITIDMQNQSRTGIYISGNNCHVKNVTIKNILSDNSGSESESGIVITGNDCFVDSPVFKDLIHGTASNGSVPRCISVQGGATGTVISDAYGEDLACGVTVGWAENTFIKNAVFRRGTDNGYYILSTSANTTVQNGMLEDMEESFVVAGQDVSLIDVDIVDPKATCGFENVSGTFLCRRVNWWFTPSATNVVAALRSRPGNSTYTSGRLTNLPTALWVSSTTFTIAADATPLFFKGREVEITGDVSGTSTSTVASADYNSVVTTVTLNDAVLDTSLENITSVKYRGGSHIVMDSCSMKVRFFDDGVIVHNNGTLDWLELHNCDFRPHFVHNTDNVATMWWYNGGSVNKFDATNNRLRLFNDTSTSLSGKTMRFGIPLISRISSWVNNVIDLSAVTGITEYVQSAAQDNLWVQDKGRLNNNTNYLRGRDTTFAAGQKEFYAANIPSTVSPTATFQVGDVAWNSAAVENDPMGWICTVAGTPGTWTPMPRLGMGRAAAQADATTWTDTNAQNDFNNLLAKLRAANIMAT